MHDHEGSTGRALGYIARVQLGTAVIHVAHALVRASSPTEEILVGVGHRVATLGFRLADCPDPADVPDFDGMTEGEVLDYARAQRATAVEQERLHAARAARLLNELHDAHGWTWSRIAREMDVDTSTVYRWSKAA